MFPEAMHLWTSRIIQLYVEMTCAMKKWIPRSSWGKSRTSHICAEMYPAFPKAANFQLNLALAIMSTDNKTFIFAIKTTLKKPPWGLIILKIISTLKRQNEMAQLSN